MPKKRSLQPGDIRTSSTPVEDDRLSRAIKKSEAADLATREAKRQGKPRPGEVLTASQAPDKEKQEKEQTEKFLRLAAERFKLCVEAESRLRNEALDDLDFRAGEQWPKDVKQQRELDGRPCLTMNRLPQFIRQVTNEQRQQRPAIQVNPVGDDSDVETAEVLQGIIRHIEVNSDAEIAYDTAFEQCVTNGFGYFEICSDYINDKTFDQELKIKRIKNPFTVYFDPSALESDYSDAAFAFKVEDMPRAEYLSEYPDSEAASLSDWSSIGDQKPGWAERHTLRVAEYWHMETSSKVLHRYSDGSILDSSEPAPENAELTSKRPYSKRRVVWSKINAIEILEEREVPGKFIRIVPVLGDDLDINGERYLAGMVRSAKDPQRMYNYWVSAGTEMIALAPKAPFVVAEGQLENHETQWSQANVRNFSYLEYKPVTAAGAALPQPQRQTFEPPIQAISLMTRQADNDLKATTGIYDASLGEKGPDQSGKAILARQKQSDVATLNFSDNLARSIRHCGRILLDLIPHYYDAPRVQRIIKPDQTVSHVVVHNNQPEAAQMVLNDAVKKVYDLGVGSYDVSVSVGPSYQSKRQEAVASQMALVQAYPQVFNVIGDMLVGNMDWPGAKQMAARLKKTIPPNLLDDDQTDPKDALTKCQAQLQAISQQHEQLAQALQHEIQLRETKQVEMSSRSDIEKFKAQKEFELKALTLQTQRDIAEITTKAQDARERMKLDASLDQALHVSAHEVGIKSMDMAHDRSMADVQHQQSLEQQDQAGQQAMAQQQQAADLQPEATQ